MSRITTKQFRAPFASAGSPGDVMLDDIFYNISKFTTPGSLAWLPDTTAPGKGALCSSTCRNRETQSDRFRSRNCTPATVPPIEPHQTGHAWVDWRRGPAARGGRGGQRQRERGRQHDGSRGTAVTQGSFCMKRGN